MDNNCISASWIHFVHFYFDGLLLLLLEKEEKIKEAQKSRIAAIIF